MPLWQRLGRLHGDQANPHTDQCVQSALHHRPRSVVNEWVVPGNSVENCGKPRAQPHTIPASGSKAQRGGLRGRGAEGAVKWLGRGYDLQPRPRGEIIKSDVTRPKHRYGVRITVEFAGAGATTVVEVGEGGGVVSA